MSEDKKRLCGAKKHAGGTCGHVAGFGTDHLGWGKCKFHGGSTTALRTAAAREEAEDLVTRLRLLDPSIGVLEPGDVLLQEVQRTARVVAFFDQELGQLVESGMDAIVMTEQGWRPRAFMDIWERERAHLAKTCKMALDAGVAERQVRLAEEQGAMLAQIIRAIFTDPELGATAAQKAAFPAIARRHLLAVSA